MPYCYQKPSRGKYHSAGRVLSCPVLPGPTRPRPVGVVRSIGLKRKTRSSYRVHGDFNPLEPEPRQCDSTPSFGVRTRSGGRSFSFGAVTIVQSNERLIRGFEAIIEIPLTIYSCTL